MLRVFAGPGFDSCRYIPTCSSYAKEVFETQNFFLACYLSLKRVALCNPWSKKDTWFPAPESAVESVSKERQ